MWQGVDAVDALAMEESPEDVDAVGLACLVDHGIATVRDFLGRGAANQLPADYKHQDTGAINNYIVNFELSVSEFLWFASKRRYSASTHQ